VVDDGCVDDDGHPVIGAPAAGGNGDGEVEILGEELSNQVKSGVEREAHDF
jgi:hypothetical protein